MHARKIELGDVVRDELLKIGFTLSCEEWGHWHWREKEIEFEGKKYLIGGHLKLDEITQILEVYGEQCLPQQ